MSECLIFFKFYCILTLIIIVSVYMIEMVDVIYKDERETRHEIDR